jgi:hypothetical protein
MLMAGVMNGKFDGNVAFNFHQQNPRNTGTSTLKMSNNGKVSKAWILLDNQSTVDIFHNTELLNNI